MTQFGDQEKIRLTSTSYQNIFTYFSVLDLSIYLSETVKVVTVAFFYLYSVTFYFFRCICAKYVIPKSAQSTDTWKNSEGGISNFWISSQSFKKENSRTTDGIDLKVGPLTKFDMRNKSTSKI